jgi:hypothetical protein
MPAEARQEDFVRWWIHGLLPILGPRAVPHIWCITPNSVTKKTATPIDRPKIGAVDGCGRLLRSTGDIHSINEMIVPRGN